MAGIGLTEVQGTRNTTYTIGGTAEQIAPMRERQVLYVKNTSTLGQIISISLSNTETASDGYGIVLSPQDIFIDANSESYICWQGAVSAISSAAGGTIAVYERL